MEKQNKSLETIRVCFVKSGFTILFAFCHFAISPCLVKLKGGGYTRSSSINLSVTLIIMLHVKKSNLYFQAHDLAKISII